MDLLKLLLGFAKVVLCISRPLQKKQAEVWPDFKARWSFCFEVKVANESKYSMLWVSCACGNVKLNKSFLLQIRQFFKFSAFVRSAHLSGLLHRYIFSHILFILLLCSTTVPNMKLIIEVLALYASRCNGRAQSFMLIYIAHYSFVLCLYFAIWRFPSNLNC